VLRRIFGPRGSEVTEGCKKLHNGELRDLYSSPSMYIGVKSGRMILAGYPARIRAEKYAYVIVTGKKIIKVKT
jgi:hypothetical protein